MVKTASGSFYHLPNIHRTSSSQTYSETHHHSMQLDTSNNSVFGFERKRVAPSGSLLGSIGRVIAVFFGPTALFWFVRAGISGIWADSGCGLLSLVENEAAEVVAQIGHGHTGARTALTD